MTDPTFGSAVLSPVGAKRTAQMRQGEGQGSAYSKGRRPADTRVFDTPVVATLAEGFLLEIDPKTVRRHFRRELHRGVGRVPWSLYAPGVKHTPGFYFAVDKLCAISKIVANRVADVTSESHGRFNRIRSARC